MNGEPLVLEALRVERSFDKNGTAIQVLRGVDLTVKKGEMLAIVGPSGAGKSTFLHILGTLDHPTGGQVKYFGKALAFDDDQALSRFRNQHIGFVFQFHHLLPEFTALENVAMPILISGKGRSAAFEQARELLDRVGLSHRLEHRPAELSGGEQQRVAIARAVALRPSIILADEPTGNLDRETGLQIHNLLVELNQSLQVSLVVATHNEDLAHKMHRRQVMIDGRLESP